MNAEVVTIGLGYIGLPTSALIASSGTRVLGVDIDENIVDKINRGKTHIVEPELDEIVKNSVEKGFLKASTTAEHAKVFLIVVPTPFKGNYEPDTSYVEDATKSILNLLNEGDLYIIESTSPVGTTEKMQELIYSSRPDLKDKIYVAYCPERVLPGNVMYELVYNDRVIGGVNKESTSKAIEFYSKYVKGELHPTNARTAEMCKLVENSSRDVQIAFANELSIICDKAGINIWELTSLANKHPRVNILKPGCGVGGHCIAVDPYFILSDYPMESNIIATARKVNNYKSFWCIEKILHAQHQFEIQHGRKPKTALMGLAFKPNIDDLRESPAKQIVEKIFESSSENQYVVEPNIDLHPNYELTEYKYAVENSDLIVFLVAHDEFKDLVINKNKVILDFCGITR